MEYYQIAAKWLADKLRNPSVEDFYVGEEGTIGYIAQLLGYMLAKESKPTEEAINAFESALAEEIKRNVELYKNTAVIRIDYHPEGILCCVLNKVKLDPNCLPKKVVIRANNDVVTVNIGGRCGRHLTLYESPDYLEMMNIP